ncbi:hypothetical protein EUGRSUZ_L02028 [Eucalyptus grandis]|uniref:Isopenicillin N synthase-like Fe(2+) 2OG dioxygenase domain-containing protein n=1 Tax=Eucalyptus grandis TaxID=71139 RepID=A0A058ZSZ8_EUCGR|nr:hypothetical protein EUGRSUZ_L02028 [Eucalyptus grandis]
MGISSVLDSGGMRNLANLMWPQGNPLSCETLDSYARRLSELEQLITMMVFRSLGVEKYLESHNESLSHTIRVMKYEAPMTREPQIGARSHYDKTFLTILQQNRVDGLEVQTKDGKWFQVAPSALTFIVMVGESFLVIIFSFSHAKACNSDSS